jgi:hypothetical protein
VARDPRGFAGMNRNKQREIASKGGKAAHAKGTAHEWSREQAREAGRKGGLAARRKKTPAVSSGMPKAENQTLRVASHSPAASPHRNAGAH